MEGETACWTLFLDTAVTSSGHGLLLELISCSSQLNQISPEPQLMQDVPASFYSYYSFQEQTAHSGTCFISLSLRLNEGKHLETSAWIIQLAVGEWKKKQTYKLKKKNNEKERKSDLTGFQTHSRFSSSHNALHSST